MRSGVTSTAISTSWRIRSSTGASPRTTPPSAPSTSILTTRAREISSASNNSASGYAFASKVDSAGPSYGTMELAPMLAELASTNVSVSCRSDTAAFTARMLSQLLSAACWSTRSWNAGDASTVTTRPVGPTSRDPSNAKYPTFAPTSIKTSPLVRRPSSQRVICGSHTPDSWTNRWMRSRESQAMSAPNRVVTTRRRGWSRRYGFRWLATRGPLRKEPGALRTYPRPSVAMRSDARRRAAGGML